MTRDDLTLWERVDVRAWFAMSVDVIMETYEEWRQDRTLRLGAGLAYYTLFAIVPFLALTAALAGQLFGLVGVQDYLADRISQLGVNDADAAGQSIAAELERRSVQSTLGLVGLGSLIFASSLVFLALVDAVNTIWHVPVRAGIRNSVRRRLISFLMVLISGTVIIGALALSAISGAAEHFIPVDIPLINLLAAALAAFASAFALAVALTLLFRYAGPIRASWLASALSAALTTVLLVIGTEAIGWYLRNFGGSSLSGAVGAVLLALTWVYYEAQIVLAGLQLVKVVTWRSTGGPARGDEATSGDRSVEPLNDSGGSDTDTDGSFETAAPTGDASCRDRSLRGRRR